MIYYAMQAAWWWPWHRAMRLWIDDKLLRIIVIVTIMIILITHHHQYDWGWVIDLLWRSKTKQPPAKNSLKMLNPDSLLGCPSEKLLVREVCLVMVFAATVKLSHAVPIEAPSIVFRASVCFTALTHAGTRLYHII